MATPTLNLTAFNGDIAQELITDAVNGLDCAKDGKLLTGIPYKLILPKVTASAGARPYRLQPDNVNTMNFTDRVLEIHRAKKDFLIEPELWRTTYIQKVRDGLTDPNQIPYEQFLMQKEFEKLLAEINDSAAYLGVLNAGGAAAVDITNGWGTKLAAAIIAGEPVVVVLGAVDDTNAGDQFETLYKSIPVPYRNMKMNLYCSYGNYYDYIEFARQNWNLVFNNTFNPKVDEVLTLPISNGKLTIKPCTWMNNSNRLIITPQENLVMGVGFFDEAPVIEVVPALSSLQCRVNYFVGFQIADTGAIFCNEAA